MGRSSIEDNRQSHKRTVFSTAQRFSSTPVILYSAAVGEISTPRLISANLIDPAKYPVLISIKNTRRAG